MGRLFITAVSLCLAATACSPVEDFGKEATVEVTTIATVPAEPVSDAVTVTGPDDNGGYSSVEATSEAWRTCWEAQAPSTYRLTVIPVWFGLTPAWLSLVVDGEPVESYGPDDGDYEMDDVWALIEEPILWEGSSSAPCRCTG